MLQNVAMIIIRIANFMKKFFTLLKYELHKILVSPSSYFVSAVFLAINVAIYVFMLREFILYDQEAVFIHTFFQCFWLPVLLSVPMLTMRTFSDDYKNGTLQLTKTASVSNFAIVCSKFVAVYLFYITLWMLIGIIITITLTLVPTLLYDPSFIDIFNLLGGYYYILLSGLMFISIGLFFSSLTENQILAGMSTFVAIFLLLLNGQLLTFRGVSGDVLNTTFLRPLNIFLQLDNACLGVFDTRIVVLYITITFGFIVFSKVSLEKKFC